MSLIYLAIYTGFTRISDYKHHWSDVLVGLMQGTVVAVIVAHFVGKFFRQFPEKVRGYTTTYVRPPSSTAVANASTPLTSARGVINSHSCNSHADHTNTDDEHSTNVYSSFPPPPPPPSSSSTSSHPHPPPPAAPSNNSSHPVAPAVTSSCPYSLEMNQAA